MVIFINYQFNKHQLPPSWWPQIGKSNQTEQLCQRSTDGQGCWGLGWDLGEYTGHTGVLVANLGEYTGHTGALVASLKDMWRTRSLVSLHDPAFPEHAALACIKRMPYQWNDTIKTFLQKANKVVWKLHISLMGQVFFCCFQPFKAIWAHSWSYGIFKVFEDTDWINSSIKMKITMTMLVVVI